MRRSLLLTLLATTALAALPAGAQAIVTPFPVDTNWIVSGNATLDGPSPTPVYNSSADTESLSADGRYVAFRSGADGLSSEDDDASTQVYVKDRETGALTLVSRRSGAGGAPATGYCVDPAISADGTRVGFACSASLDDADTNNDLDVYVRDWQAANPTTTLVSRQAVLGPVLDGGSSQPSLSATGEYVAFVSRPQLDGVNDTNAADDIYRRRIGSGDAVVLVSRKAGGGVVGNDESRSPSISDSGMRVAFESKATNLLAAATTRRNVYVAEPAGGTLTLASSPTLISQEPNGDSGGPALSGDGSAVAFWSQAGNLNNGDNETGLDVHRRNLTTSVTTHVSTLANGIATSASIDEDGSVVGYVWGADVTDAWNSYVLDGADTVLISRRDGDGGTPADGGGGDVPSLSANGQVAAFGVYGAALTDDADPQFNAVYVRDRSAAPDTTALASRPPGSAAFVNSGAEASTDNRVRPISADGGKVAFARTVSLYRYELVVRDTATGTLTIAGRADGADGAIDYSASNGGYVSADGTRVAWATDTPVDPVLDTNETSDIYVRDLASNRTYLASRADGAAGAVGSGGSYWPALDADGSRVAFMTYSINLGNGDVAPTPDVHVRDLATDRTLLASSKDGPDPVTGNGGVDGQPAISADGTKVAFASVASDLGDGDNDAGRDIHIRDLAAGTTRQVSATPEGVSGSGNSTFVSISADGSRVGFASTATNLVEDFPGSENVYVRDLSANTLVMAGRASGAPGEPAASTTRYPQISGDGRSLLFVSAAQNLGVAFSGEQAFLRDLDTQQTILASRTASGQPVPGHVDGTALSPNGSCLMFTTAAAVIAAPVSPDFDQVYLRAVRPGCGPASAAAPGSATPPPSTPNPQPAADAAAPQITGAKLSRKRFRVGRKATALIAARAGTTLRLALSEAATLKVVIQRARPGKKVASTCKRVRKPVARNRCTAWSRAATLTRSITKAGPYRMAFSGRVGKRKLAPGSYRFVLRATDAAGNRSKPVRLGFRIVRSG